MRLVGTSVFIHCFYRIQPPLGAPAGDHFAPVEPTCCGTNATERFRTLVKQVHAWLLEICSVCRGLGWQPVAETSTDMECWRWQARTIFWFMGCPCDKILQVAEFLGSGRLQPRTKFSGCSTCRIWSHLCICNIFVRSHPLCPKWAAVPWHTGAKSKSQSHTYIHTDTYMHSWVNLACPIRQPVEGRGTYFLLLRTACGNPKNWCSLELQKSWSIAAISDESKLFRR